MGRAGRGTKFETRSWSERVREGEKSPAEDVGVFVVGTAVVSRTESPGGKFANLTVRAFALITENAMQNSRALNMRGYSS